MTELRLKDYQERTLDALRGYFDACVRLDSAEKAFAERLRDGDAPLAAPAYHTPTEELAGLPYVCLRLPTGAGKTLLAAHTPNIARRHLLRADTCVVLWLVTSDTIRRQTLDALKDRDHPYRLALERGAGDVEVMDMDQAVGITRARLNGGTVVIVATIQSFRRDDAQWLRAHRPGSAAMDALERWESAPADAAARLERLEGDGRPLYSLANALCLRRPVVIVDEAHNANTPLSYDTLAKVYPSCIIEFTATPKAASNVLHSVSASELDAEEMIKMPIRLETRPQWRELLADAVRMRDRLEEQARREREEHGGEYLRPVMLIQAQKKNEEVTVEVIKNCLLEDHRIPEAQIAVATGAEDTLAGQDVMSPDCPVRHIITVDKLREGWDCPFAYVLATVREMQSSTAIQQILGRVMRLPHARKRQTDALNRAYAFSVSDTIGAALGSLRDTLVQIGFEKFDARNMVVPAPAGGTGDLLGYAGVEECPAVSVPVPAPLAAEALSEEGRAAVAYDEASESLLVSAPISDTVARELEAAYPTPEGRAAVARAVAASHRLARRRSPAETGTPFEVPLLCCRQDDFLEVFDEAHFMDRAWELRKCDAALSEAEYPRERPAAEIGEIVQDGGRLQTRFLQHLHEQMAGLADPRGWTAERLAVWLDRAIPHHDLPPSETGPFLVKALGHLMTARGIALADLVHEKYRLKDALEAKIEGHRQTARKQAFQELIAGTDLTVVPGDPMTVFSYTRSPFSYGSSAPYTGHRRFDKHFYPKVYDLKTEGEEYACACFLDSLDEVDCWVRNIERRPDASFWLQTSTDRFYPDFVCKLRDGRILVVEYKGEDRWSNDDSREKRQIGEVWQERSGGACLFVMPRGKDFDAIKAKARGADAS